MSYIQGNNSLIYPERHYDNIFSEKLVNELHERIQKHPHVIQSANVSDSLLVKINGTLIKKQEHMLQISVRELYNDLILPIYQGCFFDEKKYYIKLCILDMPIRKYTLKHIKPMGDRNKTACG